MIILLLLLIIEITHSRLFLFYLNSFLKSIILAKMAFWNKPIRQNCLYSKENCDVSAIFTVQSHAKKC
ncbi:conserved hypothetical protein [Listeria monocytogenes FSL N1-017]|nr:conserved hypothetical protein [Listeria monocytogenes FSL R2-503]EFK41837.1 conserved hypothetical protein [Listeria monocytogenes FSL N1-017]